MTITELLAHVGDDHITFQTLDTDATAWDYNGGRATVTFATAPEHVLSRLHSKPSHVGLVVWLPKGRVPKFDAEGNPIGHSEGEAPQGR